MKWIIKTTASLWHACSCHLRVASKLARVAPQETWDLSLSGTKTKSARQFLGWLGMPPCTWFSVCHWATQEDWRMFWSAIRDVNLEDELLVVDLGGGTEVKHCLNSLKADCASGLHLKGILLTVSWWSDGASGILWCSWLLRGCCCKCLYIFIFLSD